MSQTIFRRFWKHILEKLNIAAGGENGKLKSLAISSDITPHIFRHTYATTLYYAGVDVKTAQILQGHSSIKMTMDVYTHIDGESKTIALDRLNDFLEKDWVSQKSVK